MAVNIVSARVCAKYVLVYLRLQRFILDNDTVCPDIDYPLCIFCYFTSTVLLLGIVATVSNSISPLFTSEMLLL